MGDAYMSEDKHGTGLDQICDELRRSWPDFGDVWLNLVGDWPDFGKIGSHSAGSEAKLTGVGPISAKFSSTSTASGLTQANL